METIDVLEQISRDGFTLRDTKDQLKDYVYSLSKKAFAAGDSDRDAINTTVQLAKRQKFVRESFLSAIGTLPAIKSPLNARITGCLQFDGYKVEKIIYESRPFHFVTANMYIPDCIIGKTPAVLFLCGHHTSGMQVDNYQIACQYLVKTGLIVLAQDPVGQGERWSYYDWVLKREIVDSSCPEHDYAGFQCIPLGESIAEYFAYDAVRGLDYLCERPEVDSEKIGVSGNSGGATQTTMLMLIDDRVFAAAPATFIMNRCAYMLSGQALQDGEQIWRGLTKKGIDHEDFVAAMAPKPLLLLAVTDDFFPLESTKQTFVYCRKFFKMHGNEDNFELFIDDSKHCLTTAIAKKTAVFFAKHLLNKTITDIDNFAVKAFPTKTMWCTKSGQINGEIAGAKFVYDVNQEQLEKITAKRSMILEETRKRNAIAFLRKKVFQNRTEYPLCIKRTMPKKNISELLCDSIIWNTQEDIVNHAMFFYTYENENKKLPVTIALWQGGTTHLQEHYDFILDTCKSGRAIMVLDVTGVGAMEQRSLVPHVDPLAFCGVMYKLNYDLLWLDDSIAALLTYDVIKSLDMLTSYKGNISTKDIKIYTSGRYSVYAEIAQLLDGRIKEVESKLPLTSYADFVKSKYYNPIDIASVIFPELLLYTDLDEIRKWNHDS